MHSVIVLQIKGTWTPDLLIISKNDRINHVHFGYIFLK